MTTKEQSMERLIERAVEAALHTDIIPLEGSHGVRLLDYINVSPADAVDLGVALEKGEDGKPRWHWYSDIRSDEFEDVGRAILRPLVLAIVSSLKENSNDHE